ncbi:MAG: hypothetical protein F6J94_30275 [Moorea sp. SIO1F2]|uniref:hypothetical protein n=1 Tax=unclassified Moorena TaxID=2683338 RepID=UPI0013BCDAAC|nr:MULTISPECIES: hypothetical protein [unclassified Moorena]NEN95892.1 hypothetical protein [Moorena sp. SIO3I7]NEO05120.1 hypothetical protein [Moorena sp. SIO3I8]NET86016.1 hypothetical protein [Moorena sp. SIO1F2]
MGSVESVGSVGRKNGIYRVSNSYKANSILLPRLPTPDSRLPTPYSLFPVPYSLFPTPYSLLPYPP